MQALTPVLVFAMLVFAGCLQGPATEAGTRVAAAAVGSAAHASIEDAAGDAVDEGILAPAAYACVNGIVCTAPPAPMPTAARAPYFDLTSMSVAESGTDLVLTLFIGKLDAPFKELDANGHRYATYAACFAPSAGAALRCASADVYTAKGQMIAFGSFTLIDDSCNEWKLCMWAVPTTLTPGAPATVTFTIPKTYAFLPGETPAIAEGAASVSWFAPNPLAPRPHGAFTMHGAQPLGHEHQHLVPSDPTEVADELARAPLQAQLSPERGPMPLPVADDLTGAPGNFFGEGSRFDEPGLDVLSMNLTEDGADVVMTVQLAQLDSLPKYDVQILLMIGVQGKDVYEMGWMKERGRGYGYAGHCISFACTGDHHDGFLSPHDSHDHAVVEAPATLTPGKPATLVVRAPMSAFPTLAKGDVANWLWLVTQYADVDQYYGSYGSEQHGDVHKMEFIDQRMGGAPHVFSLGNAEPHEGHHMPGEQ